jgi:hypothetical protein
MNSRVDAFIQGRIESDGYKALRFLGPRLTLRLITGSIGIVARMDIASAAFFSARATFGRPFCAQ